MKKTRKQESYLEQQTTPLHFKPYFKNIQKINPKRKGKQKTKWEHNADFQSERNSETDKEVGLSHSNIQTPEMTEKYKSDAFITKSASFSVYQHHAVHTNEAKCRPV